METFDFPFHTQQTEYPESGTRIQLGAGYMFSSPPNGPDLRRFSLKFPTMLYDVNSEPTSTNYIPNNFGLGASVSTGALPTGWVKVNPTGGNIVVVGIGVENDIPYLDLRITGNGSSTLAEIYVTAPYTLIPAVVGEVWTSSIYTRYIVPPPTGIASRLSLQETNAALSSVANTNVSNITPRREVPLDTTRVSVTRTLSGMSPSTAHVRTFLGFDWSAQAVDFTVRIGGIQLEKAATASSLIQTKTAAVTRTLGSLNLDRHMQVNMGRLEAFYNRHKLHKTFIYPHPVYGNVEAQFYSPLKIPEGMMNGNGALKDFTIELVEIVQ